MISLIWAQDKNGVIGEDGDLPWHLGDDFANFKKLTTDNIILMGAKTYDSLPKRPLPNRINYVLTHRDLSQLAEGVGKITEISRDELNKLQEQYKKELFVIGGVSLFEATIDIADRLYISYVDAEINDDPDNIKVDFSIDDFKVINSTDFLANEKNDYNFKIVEMIRK